MKSTITIQKTLIEGDLEHTYSPLQNLLIDKVPSDFTVKNKLNLSLNHPINIECQPSYDGTVNLIINDDYNPPRIINTRFSKIEDNRFKIINRNQAVQSNTYHPEIVDLETRLFRTSNSFPVLDLTEIYYGGNLKGGNYVFYVKFADSDENETDVVCESGVVSIFNGTLSTISSITGTLLNEETNKAVSFNLSNIDTSFPKFYIYFSRETSDLNGFRITEYGKFTKSYDVSGKSQKLTIYGYEETELISENDLNINYLTIGAAKTQAQVQNMLFFGNVQKDEIKYKQLQDLSYYIKVTLRQKNKSIGWISPITYKPDQNGTEYYDPKNIYYNLGYWPGELYRLGIVYILNDDSLTPAFNLRGCGFNVIGDCNLEDSDVYNAENPETIPAESFIPGIQPYTNSMGVFKNPAERSENRIQNYSNYSIKPWYYEMDISRITEHLSNIGVKGFFFVRQKRIPITLCQGLSIGIDNSANIPCIYNGGGFMTETFLNQKGGDVQNQLGSGIITAGPEYVSGSGLLSVEAQTIPEINSKLDGSKMALHKTTSGEIQISDRHYIYNGTKHSSEIKSIPCVFVKENTPYKYMSGFGFSTRAGSELTQKEFSVFGTKPEYKYGSGQKLVRGIYTSFIGVCGKLTPNSIYNVKTADYSEFDMKEYISVRGYDNSPFYAISNRYSLNTKCIDVYRGDCFTATVTVRLNRNFRDPDTPINDTIIDPNCWKNNYHNAETTAEQWTNINRADLNAVPLGMWVTYKCLASYNIGLRSKDDSDLEEMALLSTPKSFYPNQAMDPRSALKISDSCLLNRGLSSTVSQRWNAIAQNVPYVKNNFDNRIMFSNVFTEENFRNGYRIFQGLSYKDIDRQYGAIVKLLPWGTNLFCVFEHGLGIVPINEKALIQTSTNQSIHMYGAGVIQNQISLISPDFGSTWADSIIRTPLGLYGVDAYAKKIWRYSDSKGLEILSDMKIQKFLNEHLRIGELDKYPIISLRNIKTHYNNYKGDVMFTFYNDREDETWNFCFNERMGKWITRYSWTPLYSENIDNIFYSLDQNRSKILAHIYNNKNCTYGLRCDNSVISSSGITEFNFNFNGSIIQPNSYEINDIKVVYIKDSSEHNLKIKQEVNGIAISENKLVINYSEMNSWFEEKYGIPAPMHLFVKINCIFDGHVHQEIIGIINQLYPNYETYSVNGFYVHGRAGIFDSLNYSDADVTNQILPTKWYDKQEPFEFEFVVNGDVGFHKIFDNLVIISNNVQPKQFEFSIIGDVYDFNKEGIFRSEEFNEDEWQTANKRKYNDIDYKVSHSFDNCIVEWDNNQNNYWIKLSQDTKNIKDFGRVQGNIHYKEDSWYVTIDPIKFRNKYKIAEDISTGDLQSTRVRDKFMKIRVKYSGEDLVIITALNTLLTISHS